MYPTPAPAPAPSQSCHPKVLYCTLLTPMHFQPFGGVWGRFILRYTPSRTTNKGCRTPLLSLTLLFFPFFSVFPLKGGASWAWRHHCGAPSEARGVRNMACSAASVAFCTSSSVTPLSLLSGIPMNRMLLGSISEVLSQSSSPGGV